MFELQKWFGKALTSSVTDTDHFVQGSPSLSALERIEIYKNQYWLRLIKALKENFPFLCKLVGEETFEIQIAIPYLLNTPSTHFALVSLGDKLPEFLNDPLQSDAATLDQSILKAFLEPAFPFFDFSTPHVLEKKLYLQPHLHLHAFQGDLFSLREKLLGGESSDHPLDRSKMHYFLLYQNKEHEVRFKELSKEEFHVLNLFKRGSSITEVCKSLEEKGGETLKRAYEEFPLWFREWTALKWFTTERYAGGKKKSRRDARALSTTAPIASRNLCKDRCELPQRSPTFFSNT